MQTAAKCGTGNVRWKIDEGPGNRPRAMIGSDRNPWGCSIFSRRFAMNLELQVWERNNGTATVSAKKSKGARFQAPSSKTPFHPAPD